MKQAKTGYQAKHLANGLKYITDKEKTDEGRYIGCNNCILENALGQMEETKKHFGKMGGRQGFMRQFMRFIMTQSIFMDTLFLTRFAVVTVKNMISQKENGSTAYSH